VGFLKFLKREKKKSLDELDLPPAPPPLEGFEENLELPEFPDFGEKISAPEEMPTFEFPEEKTPSKEEAIPEFPAFPEMEEEPRTFIQPKATAIPEPAPMLSQSMPLPQAPEEEQPMPANIYPKMERRLFAHEKRLLRERPSARTIYVRVDNFKAALGNINIVRSDLRKSEEALAKLENMKNAKDKSLDKMKSLLDDLQKKLIFIDKTLFEGEQK